MTADSVPAAVLRFYDALNLPGTKDIAALLRGATREDWRSYSSDTTFKGRDELIALVTGFGRLIPDLRWEIREVIQVGDKVVVRSTASGTPVAPFMGAPQGGRFEVMTIDIHTLIEGELAVAHHIEDWMGAVQQLSAAR